MLTIPMKQTLLVGIKTTINAEQRALDFARQVLRDISEIALDPGADIQEYPEFLAEVKKAKERLKKFASISRALKKELRVKRRHGFKHGVHDDRYRAHLYENVGLGGV